MKKSKIIVLVAIGLMSIGWLRVFWQTIFKVSPARTMEYIIGKNAVWKNKGFPHANYPRIVDGHYVWKYGMYDKDPGGKKSGFIRFDLKKGLAEMKWQFPGKSRFGRIFAMARHKSGKVAVVWSPHMGKQRLDVLLPSGGLLNLGQLPIHKNRLNILGLRWNNDHPEVACGSYLHKATFIYRSQTVGKWQKKSINWKGVPNFRTVPQYASYKNNAWQTVFVEWQLLKAKKKYSAGVYSFRENESVVKRLGTILIATKDINDVVDSVPGNLLRGGYYYPVKHQIRKGKLKKIKQGVLARVEKKRIIDTSKQTFLFKGTFLERQLHWKVKYSLNPIIQYMGREIKLLYKKNNRARNIRYAMFIQEGKNYSEPIVEGFRFRGTPPVVVPGDGGSFWLLGTFGYYVKVNHKLKRIDILSFFERYGRVIASFSGRAAQYDDRLLDGAFFKKLIMPIIHFGLLLCWLIVFIIKRKQTNSDFFDKMKAASLTYIIIWVGLVYWFWGITVNF